MEPWLPNAHPCPPLTRSSCGRDSGDNIDMCVCVCGERKRLLSRLLTVRICVYNSKRQRDRESSSLGSLFTALSQCETIQVEREEEEYMEREWERACDSYTHRTTTLMGWNIVQLTTHDYSTTLQQLQQSADFLVAINSSATKSVKVTNDAAERGKPDMYISRDVQHKLLYDIICIWYG